MSVSQRFAWTLLALISMGAIAQNSNSPELGDDSEWRPGSLFRYRTRVGEEDSRLVVVHKENHPQLGAVYVVHVDKLFDTITPGVRDVSHCITVTESALRAAVIRRVGDVVVEQYEYCLTDGWLENWEIGNVEVFDESIVAALDFIDQVIGKAIEDE